MFIGAIIKLVLFKLRHIMFPFILLFLMFTGAFWYTPPPQEKQKTQGKNVERPSKNEVTEALALVKAMIAELKASEGDLDACQCFLKPKASEGDLDESKCFVNL